MTINLGGIVKEKSSPSKNKTNTNIPKNKLSVIAQLKDSIRRSELVAIIGTGVSMSLTNGSIQLFRGLV
jgi:hypothetical protein